MGRGGSSLTRQIMEARGCLASGALGRFPSLFVAVRPLPLTDKKGSTTDRSTTDRGVRRVVILASLIDLVLAVSVRGKRV